METCHHIMYKSTIRFQVKEELAPKEFVVAEQNLFEKHIRVLCHWLLLNKNSMIRTLLVHTGTRV